MVTPPTRERRSQNSNIVIPPDITLVENNRTNVEVTPTYDPLVLLENFLKLDYIEKYIGANFQHGKCFMDDIKKKYGSSGNRIKHKNSSHRFLFRK